MSQSFAAGRTHWYMLVHSTPALPSSRRVAIWRKLKSYGAVSILNSVWILPDEEKHYQFFKRLIREIEEASGKAFLFHAESMQQAEEIVKLFQQDRVGEYREFIDRCEHFLQEVTGENSLWESLRQDYQGLTRWLEKIKSRDLYQAPEQHKAQKTLEQCRAALEALFLRKKEG